MRRCPGLRTGLRLQILLLVSGLLVLAFGPLLWAESTLARVSIDRVEQRSAQELGLAVAQAELSGIDVKPAAGKRLLAGWVLQPNGRAPTPWGDERWAERLLQRDNDSGVATLVKVGRQQALAVLVSNAQGTARVAVALDDSGARLRAVTRPFALYMGLVALMLLVAVYLALGRLVIQPLDTLARAAERVAAGSRRWEVPRMPARELVLLDDSLSTMTAHLLNEELELRQRIDDVNAAADRLKQAQQSLVRSERLASVGRLAAGLAHEIGNPIASLIGLEDLVIEGGLSPSEQADFLARMRRETERIHRVLRDLLDFARPSQSEGRGALKEPGDVASATADALALVKPQKVMKEIQIEQKIARVAAARRFGALRAGSSVAQFVAKRGRRAQRSRHDLRAREIQRDDSAN